MKEEAKQASTSEELCRDPQRAAYMIAWRDRYIERLEDTLKGREEERQLLCSLLYYALFSAADKQMGKPHEITIDKEELRALLGEWSCTVENGEKGYTVCFSPQEKVCRDAAQQED